MQVEFRRMTDGDLPMLHGWLNDPDVAPWWPSEQITWDGLVEHHASKNSEEQYIVVLDGRDAGWMQTYPLDIDAGYQEACASVGVAADAGGVDYLLAAPADRGRGIGPVVIRRFVDDVVFGRHPWPQACAGPETVNRRSWRALEKAGFRFAGEIDVGGEVEHLMVIDRTVPLHG
jgi:RimJ/RimL family protein N-acetyltransferase